MGKIEGSTSPISLADQSATAKSNHTSFHNLLRDAVLYHRTSGTAHQTSCKWLIPRSVKGTLGEACRCESVMLTPKNPGNKQDLVVFIQYFSKMIYLYTVMNLLDLIILFE